ncbi:Hypothetical protein HVR_LOCUS256 [uncultured virus]|nr:Hypothetical protein HVR_LOCUS256 [uncultured virus]
MSYDKKYPFRYLLDTGCFLIKSIPIRNNSVIGLTTSILAANPIASQVCNPAQLDSNRDLRSQTLWKKIHKCYQHINYTITEIEGTDNLEFGKILNFEVFYTIFPGEIKISVKNPGPDIILINGSVKVEKLEWN